MHKKELKKSNLLFLTLGLFFLLALFPAGHAKSKKKMDRLMEEKKLSIIESLIPKLKGKKQEEYYRQLGDIYLERGDYLKAGDCYKKSGYTGGYARVAEGLLKKKEYNLALEYFEKGPHSPLRAGGYEKLADYYHEKKDNISAKKYYSQAVHEYEFLLKNFGYEWKNEYFAHLKRCAAKRSLFEKTDREKAEQALLKKVLTGAGKYCDKMKKSVFHFFCNEHIVEIRNYSREIGNQIVLKPTGQIQATSQKPVKRRYLYEYQLIREGETFYETRTLLKKNGLKKNVPEAQLEISDPYEKLIFGPIALLSSFWQDQHRYKVIKEEKLWGENTVVIEAIPLRFFKENRFFGKIWVSKDDFGVLKVRWNPKSLDASRQIEKMARASESKPQCNFFVEFKVKKNGNRFPSRYYLEESYANKRGKKFVRSKLDVTLKDYRFFVVGTEVTEAAPELK